MRFAPVKEITQFAYRSLARGLIYTHHPVTIEVPMIAARITPAFLSEEGYDVYPLRMASFYDDESAFMDLFNQALKTGHITIASRGKDQQFCFTIKDEYGCLTVGSAGDYIVAMRQSDGYQLKIIPGAFFDMVFTVPSEATSVCI